MGDQYEPLTPQGGDTNNPATPEAPQAVPVTPLQPEEAPTPNQGLPPGMPEIVVKPKSGKETQVRILRRIFRIVIQIQRNFLIKFQFFQSTKLLSTQVLPGQKSAKQQTETQQSLTTGK